MRVIYTINRNIHGQEDSEDYHSSLKLYKILVCQISESDERVEAMTTLINTGDFSTMFTGTAGNETMYLMLP